MMSDDAGGILTRFISHVIRLGTSLVTKVMLDHMYNH